MFKVLSGGEGFLSVTAITFWICIKIGSPITSTEQPHVSLEDIAYSQGYHVRAVVRSTTKGNTLKSAFSSFGDRLEIVIVGNLISDDLSYALKGVESVIHAAAPLPGQNNPAEALDVAVKGSLNILRQAYSADIKKFVYVSSIVTINPLSSDSDYKDTTWANVSKEDALSAIWEFADIHLDLDVTVLNPPFFFGPYPPNYSNPDASRSALNTNGMIYALIRPHGNIPIHPSWIDVRDVAQAAVNALTAPPASKVGRKRIPLSGEWFSFKDAAKYVAEVRPELKNRISEQAKKAPPVSESQIDNSRAREILRIELTPWKKTVIDAVDDLLELEKEWKRNFASLH
ncbi:NAD(P)-binding domain superfamily protein [Abortiporus biennis]